MTKTPPSGQHACEPDTEALRERFLAVSTATLTTALFKRGFRNVFIQGVRPLNPQKPRMAGPAFTLRYIPAREDIDHIGVFEDRDHPQRRAVEEIPPGYVFVIDSRRDGRAASAGSILITRMMVRGAAGVVTDGGLRDSGDIGRLPLPVYCARPSPPTNLVHHHALDINQPIGCGDVPVYPGDWVVGDEDGVVVVPAAIADEVADEAAQMTVFEGWVEARVRQGRSILGLSPASPETRAEFEAWKAAK